MVRQTRLPLLLALITLYCLPAGALDIKPLWRVGTGGGRISASPTLFVDGARRGVVVCSDRGAITLYGGDGKVIWSHSGQGARSAAAAVADLDGDGHPEVVSGNRTGEVTCLDAHGRLRWRGLAGSMRWTAPVIADVTGDRRLETAVADDNGFVSVFDADGVRLWRLQMSAPSSAPLGAADVDGCGRPEILVVSDDGVLYVLGGDGHYRWLYRRPGADLYCAPTAADLEGDGRLEVVEGYGDGAVICLDGPTGRLRWRAQVAGGVDSAVSVADLDGDGRREVLVGDGQQGVTCLTADGRTRWCYAPQTPLQIIVSAVTVADLNGDGQPEIAAGLSRADLVILDRAGKQLAAFPGAGNFNTSPLLADVNGDGRLEITATARDEVLCLATGSAGKVQWAGYRNTPALTGAVGTGKRLQAAVSPAARPGGPAWHTLGMRAAEVVLRVGPAPAAGILEARIVRPDGVAFLTTQVVSKGQSVNLPFAQWVNGTYTVSSSLRTGNRVLTRTGSQRLGAFAPHLAAIRQGCAQAEQAERRLGAGPSSAAEALQARRLVLAGRAAELAQHAAAGRISQQEGESAARLTAEARTLARLAQAIGDLPDNRALLVWQANPWQPFTAGDLPPAGRPEGTLSTRPLYQDEVQHLCLDLLNVTGRHLDVRVEPGDITAGETKVPWASRVRLLTLRSVGTKMGYEVWDALPPLGPDRIVQVPSLETRQLWLTLDTGGLAPGKYRLPLTLATTEQWHRERRLVLDFEVLPLSLKQGRALRFCHWGYFYFPGNYLYRCQEAAVADQVAHGTNVFVFEGNALPRMTFDAEGNLQSVDWQDHDRLVGMCAPHGILLYCGYPGHIVGPAWQSEAYWRAYATYIRETVKHDRGLGLGYADFAFYPVDEPGLTKDNARAYINYAKAAKAADPQVRMYTDPVPGMTLAELAEAAPYTDIWCPNGDGVVMKKPDYMRFFNGTQPQSQVWTYRCSGDAKTRLSMTNYYRGSSWLAWKHRLTGIGFWTYCTTQYHPWQGDEEDEGEYVLVYPGEVPIASRRWEAAFAGLQDYRALDLLQQAVEAAGSSADPETLQAARMLLSLGVAKVVANPKDDHGAAMDRLRREAAVLTMRLRGL